MIWHKRSNKIQKTNEIFHFQKKKVFHSKNQIHNKLPFGPNIFETKTVKLTFISLVGETRWINVNYLIHRFNH